MPSVEELGALEVRGVVELLRLGLALRERAGHADHLHRAVAEVVRLLGVEREDPVRELLVRRDERRHVPHAEHLRRGEAVAPVRRPEAAVRAAHHDDRVEEGADLVDLRGEALGVRRREIALEGSRRDGVARQRRDEQRLAGERLPIAAERDAARLADRAGELRQRDVVERQRDLASGRTARVARDGDALSGRSSSGARLLLRALLRRHVCSLPQGGGRRTLSAACGGRRPGVYCRRDPARKHRSSSGGSEREGPASLRRCRRSRALPRGRHLPWRDPRP